MSGCSSNQFQQAIVKDDRNARTSNENKKIQRNTTENDWQKKESIQYKWHSAPFGHVFMFYIVQLQNSNWL